MSSAIPAAALPLARLVLLGAVLPAVYVAVDVWLIGSWSMYCLMAALVVQVGVLGVLCSRLLDPPWLRWIIYGWVWALLDGTALPFTSVTDNWDSTGQLAISLISAQLGLVTVWVVLGKARWSIRWPCGLVLATALFVPLIWNDARRSGDSSHNEFLLLFVVQCLTLAAICGLLWWRGYRLIQTERPRIDSGGAAAIDKTPLASTQFGIRDVLLWTTSLAIALAVARALDFWGVSLAVVDWIQRFFAASRVDVEVPLAMTAAVLTAIVLVIALWAALGQGHAAWRWSLLVIAAVATGVAYGYFHFQVFSALWGTPAWQRSILNPHFRRMFFQFEDARIAWFCLAGGLLFAALLSLRTIGYRLCRVTTAAPHTPRNLSSNVEFGVPVGIGRRATPAGGPREGP